MYRNTVYDFIRRTKANLVAIENGAEKKQEDFFEVTQLINSVIGLLMFPKEAVYNLIPETSLEEFKEINFPKILHGKLPKNNFRELVRYLRNGFAHYNVYFENHNNIIKGLYIWNIPPDAPADWVVYISIPDLRELLELAEKEFKKVTKKGPKDDALDRLEKSLGKRLRITSLEGLE